MYLVICTRKSKTFYGNDNRSREKKSKIREEIRSIETLRILPPNRLETQPKSKSKFLKAIGKILIWLGRDNTSSIFMLWGNRLVNVSKDQGELVKLHLEEIESEIQILINNIREIFLGLPINEDLLDDPELDLYHKINELNDI